MRSDIVKFRLFGPIVLEKTLRKWLNIAKSSGLKGWILVKDGKVVGRFDNKKDAVMAAVEPGIYLLALVE